MKRREQEQNRTAEEVLDCPSLQQTIVPANLLASADLSNVIFLRRQQPVQVDAPPCIVDAASRPAPLPPRAISTRFAAALVATIVLHGAALAAFMYQPAPLPSIGVEAISVELVIGSQARAGQQQTPSENEFDQAEVKSKDQPVEPVTEPVDDTDAKIADKRMELAAVQPTLEETKPEQPPQAVEPPKPEETKPVQTTVEPVTVPKPSKPLDKLTPKPVERVEPKHAKTKSDRDTERTRQRVAAVAPQPAIVSGNGLGIGNSSKNVDYSSLVLGHLLRFKPATPLSGSKSVVTFSLNSSGAVTSSRLTSSSGNAQLDELALSMVRRASPFPAPPDGRGRPFNAPIVWNR